MKLKKATKDDVNILQNVCMTAYSLNFKDHWVNNGLDLYLEKEFNKNRLINDLNSNHISYYFIVFEHTIVGFIKIKTTVDGKLIEDGDCELEKFYILPNFKGKGLGKFAMNKIINMMKITGKQTFILDVINTNIAAISFYERFGFKKYGTTLLTEPFFKEELRGMYKMKLTL